MLFNLTELSAEPLYSQISRQLAEKILAGDIPIGGELSPLRVVARKERVNLHSVEKAYRLLERQGLIHRRKDNRYFVASLTPYERENFLKYGNTIESTKNKIQQNSDKQQDERDFHQLLLEKQRFEEEIKLAIQIQSSLLPGSLPNDNELSVAAYSKPSRGVGGDFYDWISMDENNSALVIADACGKGLPAAFMVSQIQAMLRSEISNGNSVQEVLDHLNKQLIQLTLKNRFVTLFFGVFNKRNKEFTYCRAGHNYPFLIHKDGDCEFLKSGGPALGIFSQAEFEVGTISLKKGDLLFFYTDGVTETMASNCKEFGEERLMQLLINQKNRNADKIINSIVEDLQKFCDEDPQDDRTMLLMKVN
jgi:serine phosphatase RsbU (regulator of sigma subunit)